MLEYFNGLKRNKLEEALASSGERAKEGLSYLQFVVEEGKGFPDILYPYIILLYNSGQTEEAKKEMKHLLSLNDHYQRYLDLSKELFQEKDENGRRERRTLPHKYHDVISEHARGLELKEGRSILQFEFFNVMGDGAIRLFDVE